MSSRKFLVAASIAAVAVLGVSCHRFNHRSPEQKAAFINGRISSKLDLNDDQEKKLKDVSDEIVDLASEFKALRDRDHEALVALVKSPEMDQAQVLAAFKEREAKIDAKLPGILAKVAELHKTLTDEQRTQIVEMIESHRRD